MRINQTEVARGSSNALYYSEECEEARNIDLEYAQKPKKLIKMLLNAARDEASNDDHDEGFTAIMIH